MTPFMDINHIMNFYIHYLSLYIGLYSYNLNNFTIIAYILDNLFDLYEFTYSYKFTDCYTF